MFSPRDVVLLFFHFKGIQNSLVRLCGCLVTCCSLLFSICQSWIHRSNFLWGPLQLPVPFHRLERRAFQAMLVSFSMLFLFRCWWNLSFYVKYLYSIWILYFFNSYIWTCFCCCSQNPLLDIPLFVRVCIYYCFYLCFMEIVNNFLSI